MFISGGAGFYNETLAQGTEKRKKKLPMVAPSNSHQQIIHRTTQEIREMIRQYVENADSMHIQNPQAPSEETLYTRQTLKHIIQNPNQVFEP